MTSASTTPGDPWVVFDYEVNMFFAMCNLLDNGNKVYAALPGPIQNAVTESALLHGRQLVDIVLSRSKDVDDINLSRLQPGFGPTRLEELLHVYGRRAVVGSPCWTLNKRLAHATTHRGSSHDYASLINQLAPLLADIVREIDGRRSAGEQAKK